MGEKVLLGFKTGFWRMPLTAERDVVFPVEDVQSIPAEGFEKKRRKGWLPGA